MPHYSTSPLMLLLVLQLCVPQPVAQEDLSVQTSLNLQTWADVPDSSIQWIPDTNSLKSVLTEQNPVGSTKYYRAFIGD